MWVTCESSHRRRPKIDHSERGWHQCTTTSEGLRCWGGCWRCLVHSHQVASMMRKDDVGLSPKPREQGDPLMPLLFSIGIQSALEEVARSSEFGGASVRFSMTCICCARPPVWSLSSKCCPKRCSDMQAYIFMWARPRLGTKRSRA